MDFVVIEAKLKKWNNYIVKYDHHDRNIFDIQDSKVEEFSIADTYTAV